MKNSVKRILSAVLALMLMASAIPTAFAANEVYSVDAMNSVPTITQSGNGGYALKTDGSLWAWSLGWAYADKIEGVAGRNIEGPPYSTNSNYIQVVDNYGLKATGELWAWGYAVPGEPSASRAVKVADNIAMIGRQMTYPNDCIALTIDGNLVKWAGNTNANGTRTPPVFSKSPEVLLTNVISFATDTYNSRIWRALKADGTLWYGDANGVVTKEMDNVAAFSCVEQLVALTLVIKKDGTLWAWGENTYGQVGNSRGYTRTAPGGIGDEIKYYQDTPVKILDNVIYAAAGTTSFAITSDGTLYGWGLNDSNELGFTGGNRVYEASWMPWNFQDVPKVITTNAAAVATTYGTTIVLKRDGTLWSCGSNTYGAAGQSTKTYSRVETLTKMMDGVALPDGMVGSGTSTPTPAPTPTLPNSTNSRVPVSDRGTTTFLDADGNIGRLWTSDDYYNGRGTNALKITVAGYDDNFNILYEKNIPLELYTYAAFYAGEEYFYIVFYQNNLEERSNVEVFRVVKYSKNWERLDAASLYSTNTVRPLSVANYGNISFAEYNEYLYIHTSQDMYKDSKGVSHQANMTFCVRTSDMAITAERVKVGTGGDGYASHSLSQDIIVDTSGNIITLDTGDAYPRGAMLYRYPAKAGGDSLDGYGTGLIAKAWSGRGGDYSGAKTTALAETSKGYIYSYWDSGAGSDYIYTLVSNGYIAFTPKDFKKNDTSTIIRPLTSFASASDESVLSISIIPTSLDGGYIFWQTGIKPGEYGGFTKSYNTYYTTYTADGTLGNTIRLDTDGVKFEAPFYHEGRTILTTSGENGDFYILKDGVLTKCANATNAENTENKQSLTLITPTTATFSDVPSEHWAYSYIETAVSYSLVQGVGAGRYEPERNVSNAEWATMAVNLFYKNDTGRSGNYWWSANMDIAGSQRNIFAGTTVAANGTSNWDAAKVQSGINRYDMAQVIYNIAKEQGWPIPDTSNASSQIADWPGIPANYREAVAYCYAGGFITGVDSKGTFSGASTMTRAQAATVLCRLLDAKS